MKKNAGADQKCEKKFDVFWSVQSMKAVIELLDKGHLLPKKQECWSEFPEAYAWMGQQLENRVGPAPRNSDGSFLWCWVKWGSGKLRKRPVRSLRYWQPAGKYALISLKLPKSSVLVSDYCEWNSVLSCGFVGKSNEEDEKYLSGSDDEFPLCRKRASWENIFMIENMGRKNFAHPSQQRLQGVFWSIELRQVISIEPFESTII